MAIVRVVGYETESMDEASDVAGDRVHNNTHWDMINCSALRGTTSLLRTVGKHTMTIT